MEQNSDKVVIARHDEQIVPALQKRLDVLEDGTIASHQDPMNATQIRAEDILVQEKNNTPNEKHPFLKRKSQLLSLSKDRIDYSRVRPRVETRFDNTRRISCPSTRESALVASCYRQRIRVGEIRVSPKPKTSLNTEAEESKRVVPRVTDIEPVQKVQGRASAPGRLSAKVRCHAAKQSVAGPAG